MGKPQTFLVFECVVHTVTYVKVKGTVHPRTDHEGPGGGGGVEI